MEGKAGKGKGKGFVKGKDKDKDGKGKDGYGTDEEEEAYANAIVRPAATRPPLFRDPSCPRVARLLRAAAEDRMPALCT